MAYNSTIRQKMGVCPLCFNDRQQGLIKGLCNTHYWQQVKMKSLDKIASKEVVAEDLQDLVKEADAVFSRYIRMSAANDNGFIFCFICDKDVRWQDAQAMHYVKRSNMFLRYDLRNVKCGCIECNEYKGGNYLQYTRRLEEEKSGITEILMEEGNLVYKYTHDELKQLISEYTIKLKLLKR